MRCSDLVFVYIFRIQPNQGLVPVGLDVIVFVVCKNKEFGEFRPLSTEIFEPNLTNASCICPLDCAQT